MHEFDNGSTPDKVQALAQQLSVGQVYVTNIFDPVAMVGAILAVAAAVVAGFVTAGVGTPATIAAVAGITAKYGLSLLQKSPGGTDLGAFAYSLAVMFREQGYDCESAADHVFSVINGQSSNCNGTDGCVASGYLALQAEVTAQIQLEAQVAAHAAQVAQQNQATQQAAQQLVTDTGRKTEGEYALLGLVGLGLLYVLFSD